MTKSGRLPWERAPEGGFVAFPLGRDQRLCFARLRASERQAGYWDWSLQFGSQRRFGSAGTKQEASDRANAAWPQVVALAEAAAAKGAKRREMLERVEQIADEEQPDLSLFAIEAAEYENLMFVMDRIRHRARTPGIAALVRELSAEFFRRRRNK